MDIIQRLIPTSITYTRPGTKMNPTYITIHETDNTGKGSNALAHAKLQERGNDRQASWHLTVDDKECYQSIPFNEIAYAAGESTGNRVSIHIEICVNSDGNYQKTVENTAEVTRQLMAQFNIPLINVVQHNKWSGKNCPSIMRGGKSITWFEFTNMLKVAKNGWEKVDGRWYFYKDGTKQTGWVLDSKWYYLDANGVMLTGWKFVKGKWYFMDASGAMKTGWIRDKNKWYYLNPNGDMAIGNILDKGNPYTLRADGSLIVTNKDGVVIE